MISCSFETSGPGLGPYSSLRVEGAPWLIFCLLLYPLARLACLAVIPFCVGVAFLCVLLQRLLITATVTFLVVAIARWLLKSKRRGLVCHRQVQLVWLSALTAWSLFIRIRTCVADCFPRCPSFASCLPADERIEHYSSGLAACHPTVSVLSPFPPVFQQLVITGATDVGCTFVHSSP